MSILAASPAPNAVKAMARQKLLGEEVVHEERFTDGPEGTKKRLKALAKKRKMSMSKMKDHPQFKTEGKPYGMTKGSGKAGGAMKAYLDNAKKMQEADKKKKKTGNPAFDDASHYSFRKSQYNSHELQGEVVSEMGGMKVKSKPKDKNPQNMALPKNVKSGVNYQTMSQSYAPVGNIFNEKKMDPVGKEDKDIDNDGDHDSTDKYLLKRRKAIGKAIAKKRGKVKEGFSAWRIDLDFNEQVKK